MNEYKLSVLPINMIEYMWPVLSPYLQRVVDLAPAEFNLDTMKQFTLNGGATICLITQSAELRIVLTLEVRTFQTGTKVLYVPLISGDHMEECFDYVFEQIKNAAKELGCSEIRGLAARPGWLRRLPDWDQAYTVISYNLEN
jgi:hypothetical protein